MKILSPGTRLGKFEVISYPIYRDLTIDYTCLDNEESSPVLLKALRPELLSSRETRDCFAQRGETWVKLNSHPHIVHCHNVLMPEHLDEAYLVLQMVVPERKRDSPSLAPWLIPGQPLPLLQSLLFALQIVRGMQYVNNQIPGLVHGDLKPENILVSGGKLSKSNMNRLRVTDFGLATVLQVGNITQTMSPDISDSAIGRTQRINGTAGTPLYMAPELWRGQSISTLTDIYALGCILYEMLVGRYPVAGENRQNLQNNHCTGNIRPLPFSLPRVVNKLIARCLALEPGERYQNWDELESAIAYAYEETTNYPVPPVEPTDDLTESERALEGWFLNVIGCMSTEAGNGDTAIKCFELALKTGHKENDQALVGTATTHMGEAVRRLGDTQRAIDCHKKALEIAERMREDSVKGSALNNLGIAYLQLGNPRQAIEYLERALAFARETGNKQGEMSTLSNLGSVYHQFGDIRRSIQYHEQGLAIARKLLDRRGESAALSNLGAIYSELGDDRRAIQLHEQSLAIKTEIGERYSLGASLNSLANAYRNLGYAQKAFDLYNKALELAKEMSDRRGEAFALNNMGATYSNLGKMDQALEHHERALQIFHEIGDRKSQGDCLTNLGFIYKSRGETQRAINSCEQALSIDREVGDMMGLALDSFNMANLLAEVGKSREALPYAEQSASILDRVGHTSKASQVHQLVAMIRAEIDPRTPRTTNFSPSTYSLNEQIRQVRQDNPDLSADMSDEDIIELLKQADVAIAAGKPTVFVSRKKAEPLPGGLPADFIERCVSGLKGSPNEKQALFSYLGEAMRITNTPGAEMLVKTVQLALLGKNPALLGGDLPEPYSAFWKKIFGRLA